MKTIKKKILLVLTNGMCIEGRIVEISDDNVFLKMRYLETLEGIQEVRPEVK
jgi:small nuclear ribonucleoprotein (snRNP)-like protein